MSLTDLQIMQMELQEDDAPYFSDEQLQYYLDKNNGIVNNALFECCILKANNNSISISGMSTGDTSKYFKMLAQKFATNNSKIL